MRSSRICPSPFHALLPTPTVRLATALLGGGLLGGALILPPLLTPVLAAPVSPSSEGQPIAPSLGVQGQPMLPPPISAVPRPQCRDAQAAHTG